MSGSLSAVSSGAFPALGSFSRLTSRQRTVVLALSIGFAAIPFLFITTFQIGGYKLKDLQGTAFFFSLALLAGVIGVSSHTLSPPTRAVKVHEPFQLYSAFRPSRERARKQ